MSFSTYRIQYATWKEDCRQMFPVVGSGRYITAPVITEEGQPIQDPLVLLETNPEKGPAIPHDAGSADANSDGSRSHASNSMETVKDPKIIQWLLTLHQIGW